jgi:hypothetical protein
MLCIGCRAGTVHAQQAAAAAASAAAAAPTAPAPPAGRARGLCADGSWADLMVGSYHLHPYRDFDDFNPGAGLECGVAARWAAALGYYRNSLNRPSFYGGAIYTPGIVDWGAVKLGLLGGIISGYNYGRYGFGTRHETGPVLAPAVITTLGRFGANFILIPPIPADNLPFTIGLQLKWRIR